MKKILFLAVILTACTKADIDPEIVGKYQVIVADGAIYGRAGSYVEFDRKGRYLERGQELGTYTTSENILTLNTGGIQTCTYTLSGNTLTLTKYNYSDVLIKQ